MSTTYWLDSAPFTTYGECNPIPLTTTTDSGHTVKQINPSQSARFSGSSGNQYEVLCITPIQGEIGTWFDAAFVFSDDGTTISIKTYFSTAAGRSYVIFENGVARTPVAIPATGSGAYADFVLASDLNTGGSLGTVLHPNRFVWGMYGDSITGMTAAHQTNLASPLITDTRYGDMWIACQANSQAMNISGVAGGKVVNTGRDSTGNIPVAVNGVRVEYGINDAPDLPAGNATFQTAYGVMIDNIRARIGPGKPIVCLRPFPTVGDSKQVLIGTLIQAAIAGKANVTYVDTDGWITESTSFMPDSLHPNAAGYALIAVPETPVLLSAAQTAIANVTTFNWGTLLVG